MALSYYERNKERLLEQSRLRRQQTGYYEKVKQRRRAARQTQQGLWDIDVWWSTLSSVRRRAKQRGLPYNLTAKYMASITPSHCPVLGIPLMRSTTNGAMSNSPSIDRIIPERGYVEGNVIVVSMLANTIRSTATPEQIMQVGEFYKNLLTKHTY